MHPAPAQLDFAAKVAALQRGLSALRGAVVAFSGGVDSTALLHAAHAALGESAVAVTADSPSLPRAELREAEALAHEIGARHVVLPTDELAREAYRRNAADRCYHCKQELFVRVAEQRAAIAPPDWTVVYGAIVDDLGDHRPGQRAAAEHGVQAPLLAAGMGKADVRRYSREHGLRTADKPSMACLSSRVPYGSAIDRAMLAQIERAEAALRELGLRQLRVRHHDRLARVEIASDELPRAFELRAEIGGALKAAGYVFVALDVFGFRSGAMNELLSDRR